MRVAAQTGIDRENKLAFQCGLDACHPERSEGSLQFVSKMVTARATNYGDSSLRSE